MTVVKVAAVLYGYCLSSRQGRATFNQEFQRQRQSDSFMSLQKSDVQAHALQRN